MKRVIHNSDQIPELVTDLYSLEMPFVVETKKPKCQRSGQANGLYWIWMTQLANHFNKHMSGKEDAHDLMRHLFLGYQDTDKTLGKTTIFEHKLKSTADLSVDEFCYYMEQIDSWAADKCCYLPRPEDHFYTEWREANG